MTSAPISAQLDRRRWAAPRLRIFGYGSLIWCPGFQAVSRTVGCVSGYKRRFYQGSVCHRGTAEMPGRVATMIPDPRSSVWGVLYEVEGTENVRTALGHLTEREARLGGYRLCPVDFRPLAETAAEAAEAASCCAYTFVAEPDNPQYLGKASLEQQARQVAMATGPAGRNADYVRRVAQFMALEVPDGPVRDPHVAELSRRADAFAAGQQPQFLSSPSPSPSQSPQLASTTPQLPPASDAVCLTAC